MCHAPRERNQCNGYGEPEIRNAFGSTRCPSSCSLNVPAHVPEIGRAHVRVEAAAARRRAHGRWRRSQGGSADVFIGHKPVPRTEINQYRHARGQISRGKNMFKKAKQLAHCARDGHDTSPAIPIWSEDAEHCVRERDRAESKSWQWPFQAIRLPRSRYVCPATPRTGLHTHDDAAPASGANQRRRASAAGVCASACAKRRAADRRHSASELRDALCGLPRTSQERGTASAPARLAARPRGVSRAGGARWRAIRDPGALVVIGAGMPKGRVIQSG